MSISKISLYIETYNHILMIINLNSLVVKRGIMNCLLLQLCRFLKTKNKTKIKLLPPIQHKTFTGFQNEILVLLQVGCKILSFLKIYFGCCGYTWMFCEGFYLHRLMSDAFSPPRSIVPIYLAGWLFPLVTSSIYAILRGVFANER